MTRRETELPIKNPPSPRWPLTGPDPTLTHLEAKPRGKRRERQARRGVPGMGWRRRARGGSGVWQPRPRRSRRRRWRRRPGARRRRAWPARRGSPGMRGPRTAGDGARRRAAAGAEASYGRPSPWGQRPGGEAGAVGDRRRGAWRARSVWRDGTRQVRRGLDATTAERRRVGLRFEFLDPLKKHRSSKKYTVFLTANMEKLG